MLKIIRFFKRLFTGGAKFQEIFEDAQTVSNIILDHKWERITSVIMYLMLKALVSKTLVIDAKQADIIKGRAVEGLIVGFDQVSNFVQTGTIDPVAFDALSAWKDGNPTPQSFIDKYRSGGAYVGTGATSLKTLVDNTTNVSTATNATTNTTVTA